MKFTLLLAATLAICGLVSSPAWAQSAKPKLEDELTDDLLKDLPQAKPQSAKAKTAGPAAKDDKLVDELQQGEDIGAPPENPLIRIGQKMRASQEKIAQRDTSAETQKKQKEIIADLARLIEQTKKQCNGGGEGKPGSGKSSAQAGTGAGNVRPGPASEATDRVGKSERENTETADVKDVLRRFWGHLPEKLREQMQAQISEQFLPKYEKLIEEYYKRLAEERAE